MNSYETELSKKKTMMAVYLSEAATEVPGRAPNALTINQEEFLETLVFLFILTFPSNVAVDIFGSFLVSI